MKKSSPLNWIQMAAQAADDRQGINILALDVRKLSSVTDLFLFVGANSHIHVRALEDAIREGLRNQGAEILRVEGQRGHSWRVLDYGSVIVHIMDQSLRDFYAIERLWSEAKPVKIKLGPVPKTKKVPKPKRKQARKNKK